MTECKHKSLHLVYSAVVQFDNKLHMKITIGYSYVDIDERNVLKNALVYSL